MKHRILKEFQSLRVPFYVGLAASVVVVFFKHVERITASGDFAAFFLGLGSLTLCTCLALIPAIAFGTEFQHRTLPLLLSQPVKRSRLWNEKMLVALGTLSLVAGFLFLVHEGLKLPWGRRFLITTVDTLWPGHLVYAGTFAGSSELDNPGYWGFGTLFALGMLCSAAFWTLNARSILGGAVFSLIGPAAPLLVLTVVLEKWGVPERLQIKVFLLTAIVYSALFCWLGWRAFDRLQLRYANAGDGMVSARAGAFGAERFQLKWFRCRQGEVLLNLFRKEFMLQRPLFILAGVMIVSWLISFVLFLLQPSHKDIYDGVFIGLSSIYIVLVALLSATVPGGEERLLNVGHWQLTLPISIWRLWGIRLLVSLFVFVVVGLVLPFLLSWGISSETSVGLFYVVDRGGRELAQISAALLLLFALGSWAINLVPNTVRAVLTAISALLVLSIGSTVANVFAYRHGGFETGILSTITTIGFVPFNYLQAFESVNVQFFVGFVLLSALALIQSLRLFRTPDHSLKAFFKNALILIGAALLLGVWSGDLERSIMNLQQYIR